MFEPIKRYGKVVVDRDFLGTTCVNNGLDPFNRMLILSVELDHVRDRLTYIAYHPAFDELEDGAKCPEYRMVFTTGYTTPRFERIRD